MRLKKTLPVVLVGTVLWGTPAAAKKPGEAWFAFTFQGQKVGYVFSRDRTTAMDGRPALLAHRRSVVEVRRGADPIRMTSDTHAWFAPDGSPIRFRCEREEGSEKRRIEGYREGKNLVIRQDVGGNVTEERVPLGDDLRLASSLEVLVARRLEVGYRESGRALDEAEGAVRRYTLRVVSVEGKGAGRRVMVETQVGPVLSRNWFDHRGALTRIEVPTLGAVFERTSRAEAVEISARFDIFASGQFKLKKRIPPGVRLQRLSVRLKSRSGKRPQPIRDDLQKIEPEGDADVLVTLRAAKPPGAWLRRPVRSVGDDKKKYLEATPYEPLSDPRLKDVVAREVGQEKGLFRAAQRINRFVFTHIRNKSLAKAYATAIEALESREGDCTEHAVLFSALAKIAGIPTRLATGLVYVPGQNVFGYHEWVEIWTGERWHPMDPTFGQDVADPTHIKLTVGLSDADGLYEAGVVAATLIGDLELEVVNYTTVSGDTKNL